NTVQPAVEVIAPPTPEPDAPPEPAAPAEAPAPRPTLRVAPPDAPLTPPIARTLTLRVAPTDSNVFVDGRRLDGRSPFVVESVPIGAIVRVRVQHRGYVAHDETVVVHDDVTVGIELQRAAELRRAQCTPKDICEPR